MRPPSAVLHVGDEHVRALLRDVLIDLGIPVTDEGDSPGVVLAHLSRETRPDDVLADARRAFGDAPVLLVLPFADDGLAADALRLGFAGCYALGRPLDELAAAIRLVSDSSSEGVCR